MTSLKRCEGLKFDTIGGEILGVTGPEDEVSGSLVSVWILAFGHFVIFLDLCTCELLQILIETIVE